MCAQMCNQEQAHRFSGDHCSEFLASTGVMNVNQISGSKDGLNEVDTHNTWVQVPTTSYLSLHLWMPQIRFVML